MTFHLSWFYLDQNFLFWSYHQKSSICKFFYLYLLISYLLLNYIIKINFLKFAIGFATW